MTQCDIKAHNAVLTGGAAEHEHLDGRVHGLALGVQGVGPAAESLLGAVVDDVVQRHAGAVTQRPRFDPEYSHHY